MELPDTVTTVIETLRESAGIERVYGEPIEHEGRTVVPVARIAYGFGGGFGEGSNGDGEENEDIPVGSGSGGGGGGGVAVAPIGALEITDDHTRFVRVNDRKRLLGGGLIGLVIGWLLRDMRN
ncbi:spore germination protein GerW family protein [Halorhabdus salina]|uniref:spore germination protein GerW family protein n=1 Tax=Halorhabdus salina TaxID=2750670 RepID=UPI0015EEC99B|nr:spore germination protein GerW family protein [Halorhabdus salina]